MIIILKRKYFSNEKEDKKKGVGGALGIAAGTAGLGAAGGYGFYKYKEAGINKERAALDKSLLEKEAARNEATERAGDLAKKVGDGFRKKRELENIVENHEDVVDSINSKIKSKQSAISRATAERDTSMANLNSTEKELTQWKSQYKPENVTKEISGLESQLALEKDVVKRREIQKKLDAAESNYNKYKNLSTDAARHGYNYTKNDNSINSMNAELSRHQTSLAEAQNNLAASKQNLSEHIQNLETLKLADKEAQSQADRLRGELEAARTKTRELKSGLSNKLTKNKRLAWGIGLGTAALGSLGAYGYYKSKNKKK